MDAFQTLEAAGLLWRHWQAGTVLDALPDAVRPVTRAEGYAVQARLPEASGRAVRGWKIAATSAVGQAHIGVSGPLAGRLLDGRLHADGDTVPSAGNRMRVAEPEFAFLFARTLPPRPSAYTVDEVLDAVFTLHPAIEIPDSRYTDFVRAGEAQLLADDACAGRFVLGPAAGADWRNMDLSAHAVRGAVRRADGVALAREGSGAAVLGDPRAALAWLVNELSGLGIPLAAGQVVITGTCMMPLEILPGDAVVADFGALGAVSMRFAA